MTHSTESTVEAAALEWLEVLGWHIAHGPDIAPYSDMAERTDYTEIVLHHRLRASLARLNPALPPEALADAFRKITRPEGSTLESRNRAFHRLLVEGVTVEYRTAGGAVRGAQVSVGRRHERSPSPTRSTTSDTQRAVTPATGGNHRMHGGLAEMCTTDPRFTAFLEAGRGAGGLRSLRDESHHGAVEEPVVSGPPHPTPRPPTGASPDTARR